MPSSPSTPSRPPKPPKCEYTIPCTTTSCTKTPPSPDSTTTPPTPPPPRKLISHIFGRNKVATKLVPEDVWPHYCRKHYQRARYRTQNWPVAQVDLVRTALDRMQEWGGVVGFEVVLRRRAIRGEESEEGEGGGEVKRIRGAGIGASAGDKKRKHPLAGLDHSSSVSARARASKPSDNGKGKKRKHTVHQKVPVPEWLREHLGLDKSFEEVRVMLAQLKLHLVEKGKSESSQYLMKRLRFPDIEILPTFKDWVYEAERVLKFE